MDYTEITEKREDLYNLWSDVFIICRKMIDSVKEGESTLNASMLKEVVQFMKLAEVMLDNAERNQSETYSYDEDDEEDDNDRGYDPDIHEALQEAERYIESGAPLPTKMDMDLRI